MPSSQGLAVGAETDPLTRARQLQGSWERLLADGALGPELPPGATVGLRPTIVESWRRSLATGLDPTDLLAPIEADESEVLERWFEHPLGSLTHVLMEQLRKLAEESRGMVVVTDAAGLVLHRVGDESLKERAGEMNLVEGARYDEAADGTNGIGTALAADHAFQVFAFEHFNERHHQWVCSGAPVHDPVSGQTIGLIDLSSLWKTAHPRSLELVTTAARTIEQHLVDARRETDSRLRRRYGDFMTRSTDLVVNRDGFVLAGAGQAHSKPFEIPEDGGEVVLGDGSVAVAAALGQGEAYLLRQVTTHHAKSAPVEVLERAEKHVRELATEQSALRQVATLVAREPAPDQLFAAVAEQVARVLAVPHVRLVRYEPEGSVVVGGFSEHDDGPFPIGSRWPLDSPGVVATVRQTGRPARVEDYAHMTGEIAAVVRGAGIRSTVASPIGVERRLWGVMVVLSPRDEPLPEDTEARLTDFTELVATAIANAESREARAVLVEEQAALRRVATLVAEAASPAEIFSAVSKEVAALFRTELVVIGKFDGDPAELLVIGVGDGTDEPALGSRWKLDDALASTEVYRTGLPARFDRDSTIADADIAAVVERLRPVATVAVPIKVEGRIWGAMIVSTRHALLPTNTEDRLQRFTDLIATAIANAEARAEVARLAEEQAALRRVATLVARGAQPNEVFWAVSDELGRLFGTEFAAVGRFEPDGGLLWEHTFVTSHGRALDLVGADRTHERRELADFFTSSEVFRTGRSARADAARWESEEGETAERLRRLGVVSTIGSPIVVEGELWGAMLVASTDELLPVDTEERLEKFTELVATAIANAGSREALAELADEQAALRRVATLVAQGASPHDLFEAVAEEVGRLLLAANVSMGRYEPDGSITSMASWSSVGPVFATGVRWPTKGTSVAWLVLQTGRSARIDDFSAATDPIGVAVREAGYKSAIGSPIVVEGRLWGVISAASTEGPMPPGSEARLASFTELVATAIANAESSAELAASRRRIVAAADDARRRIERDLHDGIQQRLIALTFRARAMTRKPGDELPGIATELLEGLKDVSDELRRVSRGIHPTILTEAGLGPALRALARRSTVPIDVDVRLDERLPAPVEAAAYYIASEALTNVAKHAQANVVELIAARENGFLTLRVRDDGIGGVDTGRGSGILGLTDRVEALGGTISIASPPRGGTTLSVRLPITT